MSYSTCAEINIILCDLDLLTRVVQFCKSSKFPLIGLLFSRGVSSLNKLVATKSISRDTS